MHSYYQTPYLRLVTYNDKLQSNSLPIILVSLVRKLVPRAGIIDKLRFPTTRYCHIDIHGLLFDLARCEGVSVEARQNEVFTGEVSRRDGLEVWIIYAGSSGDEAWFSSRSPSLRFSQLC